MSELENLENRRKRVTFNTVLNNSYASREAFKTLRTNIMFCGTDIKVIVLTSPEMADGKSTVSTELAKSFSDIGKKTLLIDADMRKSVLLKRNNYSSDVSGLSEVLSGLTDIDKVIYNTQEENFDVIFTGHFPPNPVDLLGGGKLKNIFAELKKQYDYIIIDSPPLGLVIDAAVIAAEADAAIILLSCGKTRRKKALEVKEQLEKSGAKIIGVIINETEKKHSKIYSKYYKEKEYYQ